MASPYGFKRVRRGHKPLCCPSQYWRARGQAGTLDLENFAQERPSFANRTLPLQFRCRYADSETKPGESRAQAALCPAAVGAQPPGALWQHPRAAQAAPARPSRHQGQAPPRRQRQQQRRQPGKQPSQHRKVGVPSVLGCKAARTPLGQCYRHRGTEFSPLALPP